MRKLASASVLYLFIIFSYWPCSSASAITKRIRLAAQTLELDGRMRELAEHLKKESSMLVFGRGRNFATALETALKVWYRHALNPKPYQTLLSAH